LRPFLLCCIINKKIIGEVMNYNKWLQLNTSNLFGKNIAITGSTGGLGFEICSYLAKLNANLILLDRNYRRSNDFANYLIEKYNIKVHCITADLEDFDTVKIATEKLSELNIDIFIHNAGAYSIPRKTCSTGFDNVFQINFVSPYYIIKQLSRNLEKVNGKVIVVSSIAHNYSKINEDDIDFIKVKNASLCYGNAKRFLTYSLHKLFQNNKNISFSVCHPGITFTNITAHYPKLIFAIIKHPMKVIFHSPKKAALSIIYGVFNNTKYKQWIGPRFFNVWGLPKLMNLKTATENEISKIFEISEEIFKKINKE